MVGAPDRCVRQLPKSWVAVIAGVTVRSPDVSLNHARSAVSVLLRPVLR